MALTAQVKDELARLPIEQDVVAQGRGVRDAAVRRGSAHHLRVGSSSRRSWTRRSRRGGSGSSISQVYGHTSDVVVVSGGCLRRGTPVRGPGRQGRGVARQADRPARQPGPPGARAPAAGGLRRRRRGRGRVARRLPRARLPHRARVARRRSRSPVPGRRRRSRWSGPPGGSGISAKAREVRGIDRVVIRDGDAIGAMLTRLGAHDAVIVWEERRMRREVRGHGEPPRELRRREPATLGPRRGGRRCARGAGLRDPRRRRPRPPACRPGDCASSTSRLRWRSSVSSPTRR